MPGRLTTHVLDQGRGRPAAGVTIDLFRIGPDGERELVSSARTNVDGRTDTPLMTGDEVQAGVYEIVFGVGDYFAQAGRANAEITFLDWVPVRFGIADPDANYHVPLLVTPWSYATYRGS